jgi:hypothetical protein
VQCIINPVSAWLTATRVSQPDSAGLAIAVHEPLNLTLGKIKLGGRITTAQTLFDDSLNDGKAVKFFVRHGHQHQQRSPRKGGKSAISG